MYLEVHMAVLGKNPCHLTRSLIETEFISYIYILDFLYI